MDINKEIENNASEYAWVYNQGENGKEMYTIAKECFIDGANSVILEMRDFSEWCLEHESFVYDIKQKFWFDSNTLERLTWDEIIEEYYKNK